MKNYPTRQCERCGTGYKPKGPAARFCVRCAPVMAAIAAAKGDAKYRKKRCPGYGLGSGGNQWGEKNPAWKGGVAFYTRVRKALCERCAAPAVLVHHKDRNRSNNTLENLESLCKRCHQIEHKCWLNLKGSETIREEYAASAAEAPGSKEKI